MPRHSFTFRETQRSLSFSSDEQSGLVWLSGLNILGFTNLDLAYRNKHKLDFGLRFLLFTKYGYAK